MDTLEGNKLISEFMGAEFVSDGNIMYNKKDQFPNGLYATKVQELRYNSLWDWLMPSFYRFKSIQLRDWEESGGPAWNHKYSYLLGRIGNAILHKSIGDSFEELVEAIQWFNNQKSQP